MWHSTSGAKVNRLQNATCGVQEKRVVCNYITIYRTHILFIEHIHHNVHTSVHPTHNHSQCTLHTHKHSHTILSYTRSPATLILPTVKMLSLGVRRLTSKVLDHYLHHNLVMLQLLCFYCSFTNLIRRKSPPKFNQLFIVLPRTPS